MCDGTQACWELVLSCGTMPIYWFDHEASAEAASYTSTQLMLQKPKMPDALGAFGNIWEEPLSCIWTYTSSSALTENSLVRDVPSWRLSPTPQWEQRCSTQGRVYSSPSWPSHTWARCSKTISLFAHNKSSESANNSQSSRMQMPVSLSGTRAASANFQKTQGIRKTWKGVPCTDMPLWEASMMGQPSVQTPSLNFPSQDCFQAFSGFLVARGWACSVSFPWESHCAPGFWQGLCSLHRGLPSTASGVGLDPLRDIMF